MNKELNETEPSGHGDNEPHVVSRRFAAHANQPRHLGTIPNADGKAVGVGVCGDAIEVSMAIEGRRILDIRHAPRGCTYTVACGSAMSHLVCGKTIDDALQLTPEDVATELDGLPDDHMHCASLAVNTLGEAIDDYYQKIWGRNRFNPYNKK
jgi:nitrogen fixation NifU-like protein